jgi:membrane fusion protein (multidrug efflux system)
MSSNQKSNVARIVSENAGTDEVKAEVVAVEAPTAEAREVPSAPAQSAPASVTAPAAAKKRRSLVLPIVVLALLAGGGWYGYEWWTNGRFMVSTDDAYIEGDIATI